MLKNHMGGYPHVKASLGPPNGPNSQNWLPGGQSTLGSPKLNLFLKIVFLEDGTLSGTNNWTYLSKLLSQRTVPSLEPQIDQFFKKCFREADPLLPTPLYGSLSWGGVSPPPIPAQSSPGGDPRGKGP